MADAQRELEIKERQAAAGRMSALIAHEIRNPLAAISGSVQVLKGELALDAEQARLMDIVVSESRRVSQSIDQFLNLGLPGRAGLHDVRPGRGRARDGDHAPDERRARRAASTSAGTSRPTHVDILRQPGQFKQVFWNLIRNALQAMPGGRDADDRFRPRAGNGAVLVRFADTGKGMTAEERARMFEPFYSRFEGGQGLGMAVVQKIVEDYEGTIEVTVRARRRDGDLTSLCRGPRSDGRREGDDAMETILIVDDEKSILDLLGVVFKKEGYQVKTNPGTPKAFELIDEGDFDILICDIKMPQVDGMDLLQRAKERNPLAPVIMITAYGSVKQAVEALRMGALDYVVKPFDIEELKILVAHGLEERRLREENILLKKTFRDERELREHDRQEQADAGDLSA